MESWVIERGQDEQRLERSDREGSGGKRFVLHRHRDETGEHLDLRLEDGEVLVGWRMPHDALARMTRGDSVPCELKRIHPKRWLDVDEDGCAVEDSGTYRWLSAGVDRRIATFEGKQFSGTYTFSRANERTTSVLAPYRELLRLIENELGLDVGRAEDLAQLLERARDGDTARKRAVERLCALGRELDGESFDEMTWRDTLRNLSLAEIHTHLRSFERRFDEKYPPLAATKRERLESEDRQRTRIAACILSEELSLLE